MQTATDTTRRTDVERRLEKEAALTAEQARELLAYDPETGELRWNVRRRGTRGIGAIAGSPSSRGYQVVVIGGRRFFAHRLAYVIYHGRWPRAQLDHIDGNKANNAVSNLREATATQNQLNRRGYASSGLKGAHRNRNRYLARIGVHGKTIHLGSFATAEEAHQMYADAARHLFGGYARIA